jgi:hypothetical protein
MRAILVGDGQFDLFESLEDAVRYTEWWWVEENTDACIYTEDWTRHELVLTRDALQSEPDCTSRVHVRVGDFGEAIKEELYVRFAEWRARMIEWQKVEFFMDDITIPDVIFDRLHDKMGFQK